MKILAITNLFPNIKEPTRGIFNKQQFLELAKLCELKVIAPLPWHYRRDIPKREVIDGIETYHPRYFMIPKLGRSLYGLFFYLSLRKFVKKIQEDFDFNLIFSTWAYPDGFGSYLIAKASKKPIFIKVHGSDINIHIKAFWRRKMIAHVLRNSQKVISVSDDLKVKMIQLGIPADKIAVIPNGIDINLFKPLNREECRNTLGLPLKSKIILFVGNLVPVKGVDYLIDAFFRVAATLGDGVTLALIGDGSKKSSLMEKVKLRNIDKVVDFVGRKPHAEIPLWINSCDLFCLPSLEEGCPNVILEAMACGASVVATRTGGIPELIENTNGTILVNPGNSNELANAILNKLSDSNNKRDRGQHISVSNWSENANQVYKEFNRVINTEKK